MQPPAGIVAVTGVVAILGVAVAKRQSAGGPVLCRQPPSREVPSGPPASVNAQSLAVSWL